MADLFDKWMIRELKSRIRLDRVFLTQMILLAEIPEELWNIVVDYVCEDPMFVDAILDLRWDVLIKIDDGVYRKIYIHRIDKYDPPGSQELQLCNSFLYNCDGTDSSIDGEYEQILAVDGDIFEVLLMMPLVDNFGNESESEWMDQYHGVVELRNAIYEYLRAEEVKKLAEANEPINGWHLVHRFTGD